MFLVLLLQPKHKFINEHLVDHVSSIALDALVLHYLWVEAAPLFVLDQAEV